MNGEDLQRFLVGLNFSEAMRKCNPETSRKYFSAM